jgi:UDP-3-O-[3-hydroxymyristoyl] glucosamine N-acyltransferase
LRKTNFRAGEPTVNRIDGLSVAELVEGLDGVKVIGDPTVICIDALPLCDAIDGCVTLVDDITRCEDLAKSKAAAVVTTNVLPNVPCTQIVCTDLHRVFTAIVKRYRYSSSTISHSSIDATAQIDPTASIGNGTRIDAGVVIGADVTIGRDCHVMPGVVVMDQTRIGDNCSIYPRVVLYENTRIDNDVQIHAGSVIGAHGFGYRQVNGRHVASAQLGFVHIESFVEIGANVTIDRGTYGVTRIGEGTKIDNLVMIAHNCHIGRHNLICSQVGIAGSCRTGDYVVMAGQVGMADHISVGDHSVIGAQSGVMENLQGHQTYLGSPATHQREQMQMIAVQRRLPEMRRELRLLRRDLDNATTKLENSVSSQDTGETSCDPSLDSDDSDGDRLRCLAFKRPAA